MLGSIKTRIAPAVAVAAAVAALAPGLARAGTWLNPVPVDLANGSQPSVALDGVGNTFAAWHSNPLAPTASVVQAAHHRVGVTGFAALPDLSTDTTPTDGNIQPNVALNGSGNGIVAWDNDQSFMGLHQLQFRTIAPDGTAGTLQTVPTTPNPITSPVVAINANGDAVIAWDDGNTVRAITRQGLNGTFTNTVTPDSLSPLGTAPLSVAIDGAGNSIVIWARSGEIDASRHPAGGSWSASPDTLSKTLHSYSDPALAANATGQMVVAFKDTTSVSEVNGTVSGGWGPTPTATPLASTAINNGPGAAIADSGAAAVGWSAGSTVEVSLRPAGGSFPAPGSASSVTPVPSAPDDFTMSGNARGDVIVAWYSFETSVMHNVVRAAVKPAGAAGFDSSQIVSDPTSDAVQPVTAFDGNGDAVVAYQLGNTPAGVATATYDGAGPLLGTPTGPSTVAQGTAASFSVAQPQDAFSSVKSVSWSFGDGSAAVTGTNVSHTFANTGTFTVTVTATDAVGNASSATLHVTVTPSNPPPPKCVVPKLKGKSLSKAKSLLTKAHCALGKVHKPKARKHHKLGKLVVKGSSPGAGKTEPAGTKVSLTLTKAPKKHKHRK
jgi:hypothetical protein